MHELGGQPVPGIQAGPVDQRHRPRLLLPERWHEPGLHQRGLADSGGSDDDGHRLRPDPRGQLSDLIVAAEEHRGMVGGEGFQPPVRVRRHQQVVELLLPRLRHRHGRQQIGVAGRLIVVRRSGQQPDRSSG